MDQLAVIEGFHLIRLSGRTNLFYIAHVKPEDYLIHGAGSNLPKANNNQRRLFA